MVNLNDLLTENEKFRLHQQQKTGILEIDLNQDVRELSLRNLHDISFVLIDTEYHGRVPAVFSLAAESITILAKRSIQRDCNIWLSEIDKPKG